jgi:hypothetical protein
VNKFVAYSLQNTVSAFVWKDREVYEAFFFLNLRCGTLSTAATTGLLYQPRMIGDGDCAEIGGMKIGIGNRSTRVYEA